MSHIGQFRVGGQVYIEVETKNMTFSVPVLENPDSLTITLIRPDLTNALLDQALTNVRVGVWSLLYQTIPSDLTGAWQADFVATKGSGIHRSLRQELFMLLSQ